MQARNFEKLYFSIATILLYAAVALLIWCVSLGSFPRLTAVSAAPVVSPPKPVKKIISGKPTRVIVPSVQIDLPVTDGIYDTAKHTWTIGNHQAYYATPTPPANDGSGTTLVYGHNNRTAFRNLRDLQPGAALAVYTDGGTVFRYTFMHAHEVQPTDTNILSYEGSPTMILQTCSGDWNEIRKLYMFKLESVEKQATK